MKTEKNILIAFFLNFAFSVFELFGGIWTGSVAILSDALHDVGDAISIGASFLFERKSKKQPDEKYTYGYARYSVLGGVLTTCILLVGSAVVLVNAVKRLIAPIEIRYNEMILFAIVGVVVNLCAAFFTRGEGSVNQKAVNLHMFEDVLGWLVVLVGAVVMRFTQFVWIDPILSIGVAIFIGVNAVKNLKEAIDLFLEKTPRGICIEEFKEHIEGVQGVLGVHHIHVWTLDGQSLYATLHIVAESPSHELKERVREELKEHGIGHATIELEEEGEYCEHRECHVEVSPSSAGHHHHHHHHHH